MTNYLAFYLLHMRIYRLIPGRQPSFLPLAVDWEKDSMEEEANESEQDGVFSDKTDVVSV